MNIVHDCLCVCVCVCVCIPFDGVFLCVRSQGLAKAMSSVRHELYRPMRDSLHQLKWMYYEGMEAVKKGNLSESDHAITLLDQAQLFVGLPYLLWCCFCFKSVVVFLHVSESSMPLVVMRRLLCRKMTHILSRLLPSNAAFKKVAPEVCAIPDTMQLERVILQLVSVCAIALTTTMWCTVDHPWPRCALCVVGTRSA